MATTRNEAIEAALRALVANSRGDGMNRFLADDARAALAMPVEQAPQAESAWTPPTAWEIIQAAESVGLSNLSEPARDDDRHISNAGKEFIKGVRYIMAMYCRDAQRHWRAVLSAEQAAVSDDERSDAANLVHGSRALRDIAFERRRQIKIEGWTPEHDDEHSHYSLSIAAACYALADISQALEVQTLRLKDLWAWTGWASSWFKPKDERANLVRAGALIAAQIERIDRATQKP